MKDGTFSAIYVVHGKDRRRVTDTVHDLTEKLLAGADPQVTLTTYDGPDAILAAVLDNLRTLPFLAPCRLVVLSQADSFITKYRKQLEDYLEAPCPTGVLILAVESFPKTTRLAKRAARIGQVISCEPIKPRDLPRHVLEYGRDKHSLTISNQVASLIVELAGDDWGVLCGAVDKLAAYVGSPQGGRHTIALADVEALVANNRNFNVFTVIEAMTLGDAGTALTRLDKMLNQDRQAEFTAVGAFAWHFRRLYNARLLLSAGLSDRAVTKQLRLWSQPDAFISQVKQLTIAAIGSTLAELMTIDEASKTGVGTVRAGLEKLIVNAADKTRKQHGHSR